MRISHLDHLVLTVADIEATCNFYQDVMGMEVVHFGLERKALRFGTQKINLHQAGKEIEPKAAIAVPGSADLCFISETPIDEVKSTLEEKGIVLLSGIEDRIGAVGSIRSVYFRDPDWNLIEVSEYL